ncbi:MAG: hypothetical protein ACYS76_08260 [Planctomycetota bacterium]
MLAAKRTPVFPKEIPDKKAWVFEFLHRLWVQFLLSLIARVFMGESVEKPQELKQPPEDRGSAELAIDEKHVKKTSQLALGAGICALGGFFSLAALCASGHVESIIALIAALVFLGLALVLGIAALVSIAIRRREVRGSGYAILSIVAAVLLSSVMFVGLRRARECAGAAVCMSSLHCLAVAANQYAKAHEGYLPSADKWCDLLMETAPSLSERIFKCPAEKGGVCNYAFNRKLDGLRLADVPNDVVLLFEANGGWNVSGGQELLTMRHKGTDGVNCNVAFGDFSVRRWPGLTEEKSLRWKP